MGCTNLLFWSSPSDPWICQCIGQVLQMFAFITAKKNFLPQANEVWGKVMFSQACVSHSVHGEGGAGVSV